MPVRYKVQVIQNGKAVNTGWIAEIDLSNPVKLTPIKKSTAVNNDDYDWYVGGTLHEAKLRDWKRATYENKLNTCADCIVSWMMSGHMQVDIYEMSDLKRYAAALVSKIDEAIRGKTLDNNIPVNLLISIAALAINIAK